MPEMQTKTDAEKYRELREAVEDLLSDEGCPCCTGGRRRTTDGGRDVAGGPHEDWCPIGTLIEVIGTHGAASADAAKPLVLVNVVDGVARCEAFDLGTPPVVVLDWDAMKCGDLTPDDWEGFTEEEWAALEAHASGCIEDLAERGFKR